jgi:predicted transcriptional regulator
MADSSKKIQEELASVKALDKILSQTLDNRLKGAKEANALQDDFLKKLRDEKDISEELISDLENYEELMGDVLKSGTKGGDALQSQLDIVKDIVKMEEARKTADEKIGGALNGQVDALQDKIKSFPILGDTIAKSINFDKIKEGASEMTSKFTNGFTEAAMSGKSFGGSMKAALGGVSKGLNMATIKQGIFNAVAMINPYVLIAAAVIALIVLLKKLVSIGMKFDQQTTDIARNFGISKDNAADMQRSMSQTAALSGETYMNSKNMLEAQSQLQEKLGSSAMYSADMLKSQIQLTKFMGLSGEEAVKFQSMAAGSGQSTREVQQNIQGTLYAFNKTTGASLALNGIMKDIANISDDVRANFRGNVKEMVLATAQAKLLGTTVDELAGFTSQTLNMESSLQKEMKLRALTGKNINLDQVRRLKLMGDEAGAAKALTEQMGSIEDFNKMLPHEQKAFADALGMTQGQMLKMLEAQELQKKAGIDLAAASMSEIKANDRLSAQEKEKLIRQKEAESAQEKMDAAMQKMKDTLNSIVSGPLGTLMSVLVEIVVFIVDVINVMLTPLVAVIDGIAKGAKAIGRFFGFGGPEEEDGTSVGGYQDSINDGVITPSGDVIKTNPADFIMATTNPAAMAGEIAGASAAGGIDYDRLAAAMGNQPLQIVVDGRVISEITKKQSMNKSFNKQMG